MRQVRERAERVERSARGRCAGDDILGEASEDEAPLTTSLARLKNSIELGAIGDVVKKADVVPQQTYDLIEKVGAIAANPQYGREVSGVSRVRES